MTADSTHFDGRIALVTGGGSGIGPRRPPSSSPNAAPASWSPTSSRRAARKPRTRSRGGGGEAVFVRADVTRADEVHAMIDAAVSSFGGLDCAINSAGTATLVRTRTHEFSEEEWRRVLDVNLTGVWLCMKEEIARMLEGGRGGAIVNLSSIYGLVAAAGTAAYTASKHAVAGLTRTAALDYAKQGDPGERPQPRLYENPDGRRGHLPQARDRGLVHRSDPDRGGWGPRGRSRRRGCGSAPTPPPSSPGSSCRWTEGSSPSKEPHRVGSRPWAASPLERPLLLGLRQDLDRVTDPDRAEVARNEVLPEEHPALGPPAEGREGPHRLAPRVLHRGVRIDGGELRTARSSSPLRTRPRRFGAATSGPPRTAARPRSRG